MPMGTFMLFGTFNGSTNSTALDLRLARCHEAGLMPTFPCGGSFLIQNGMDGTHGFQLAWAQTVNGWSSSPAPLSTQSWPSLQTGHIH
ncbi:uncharacterized protein ACA1_338790 [Acanthamoeba castellanii str. Neff]|uniref:Uncharacterized protein n=1 Tax=Acanthamoeba castellanii (strain ATCC 30010 / Neff) TaxID=1257118 RepID=L8H4C5_ACACF|nr:uncharacterized protein ACA1_338790 [Acanthamoeba castellanii str. Neff]ELR20389.1 hypothetical protein ACA1_338790 [Acanthamoeba castellanii str. Neff]